MSTSQRAELLGAIKQNIRRYGRHIYAIGGGASPRYAYTIGLRDSIGAELVLPGAAMFDLGEVQHILNTVGDRMRDARQVEAEIELDELGTFTLRRAHASWTDRMLLGALDYYNTREVRAYQIVPDEEHWTIDVPDLAEAYGPERAPVWRWLDEPWTYPVPETSIAVTNLDALCGNGITEAGRMEDDAWELFAGPAHETLDEEVRVVPLGTLLAYDPTLIDVLTLRVGAGVQRICDCEPWRAWDPGY